MNRILVQTVLLLGVLSTSFAARLAVSGMTLTYGGKQVYLNGENIPWNNYGYDFGNGVYDNTIEQWMQDIGSAGGNSVRMWVHVEGQNTPSFDGRGMVTACDNTGDFLNDVVQFLDSAQQSNVLVMFTVWNGAVMENQPYIDMVMDDNKIQSYLDNCLTDWVNAVKGHPALGSWEPINEPEGSVQITSDSNPCYDTTIIGQSGAGWTGADIPIERFLILIGKMNQLIRELDPQAITTQGSWGQWSETDAFSDTRNHYTDTCLNGAAGSGSQIDFYQMHAYDWNGEWSPNAPFTVKASDYKVDKPILLGEYAGVCAAGTSLEDLNIYAYENGYVGGFAWCWLTGTCSDSRQEQRQALGALSGRTDYGTVDFIVG
uniref:GH5 family protein GH5E n=1 Tax=Limnoria quadripunctata TaxID=161573 RepID=D5IEF7_LIMQU|nr:GH5 family protein GH5E [Limnoria quadripunctata]